MSIKVEEPLTPLQQKLVRMMDKSPRLLNFLLGMGIGIITEVRDEEKDEIAAVLRDHGYDLDAETVPTE